MQKRGKWFLAGLALLLVAAAAAPWLIPTGAWIGRIETEAGARLGAPVRIGGIRAALLPLPHAAVNALDVADGAIAVQRIVVYPRLWSLFSDAPALGSIEFEQVSITPKGAALAQAAAATPNTGAALKVERVRASRVQIELAAGKLPVFDADVDLNNSAAMPVKRARISTTDGKAALTLKPADTVATAAAAAVGAPIAPGAEWALTLEARDWPLPLGPQLRFDRLQATGRVGNDKLELGSITAALYGGTAAGKADLAWQKGWRFAGDIKVTGVELAPLTQSLKLKSALTGKLDASGPFRAHAPKPAGLAEAFNAEIAFDVRNGVLRGFDLASAAQSLLKGGAGGGNTQFDQLTGAVKVQGRALKLQNVRVTSGVLKATGNVDISPARQLAGRVETEVKGTGGLVGVPLAVSGTLDAPVLLPTRGSMAGAVVGSVLLPGVGTSIGSTVGDKIGKMFGK